ncbi:Cyclomaltodextrinase, partial [Frankliniella fusca]
MNLNTPRVLREPGSRRGSHYYHIGDGFHLRFNRVSETSNTIYFICVHVRCSGRAVWHEFLGFSHTQPHDHPPDLNYTLLRQHRRNIVERARTIRYVSFRDIVEEERRRAPVEVASVLTYRSLRPAMLRSRTTVFPNVPQSLHGLMTLLANPAWHHLTATNDGTDNLFNGGGTASDGSHVILFISQRGLRTLRLATLLFADGTFFVRPSIDWCYQVFVIVIVSNHTVIPLAWFLMERKTEAAYIEALLLLRAKLQQWNATTVVCDFEDAMMNAFRLVLGVDVQGCLFHCAHDMSEYARIHVGVMTMRHLPFTKFIVNLCCALPLLPTHLLQRGFNVIAGQALQLGPYFTFISSFLSYVQREWLNHSNRGQTLSVCGSNFRTNNASESNNRRMKRKIGVHHPNIYHFIRHLADFESTSHNDLTSLLTGHDPTRSRAAIAISNDNYIQELTSNLLHLGFVTDQDLLQFLTNASVTMRRLVRETIQP